ncbi:cobalamin biosynthesis protein [Methylosinus sporium]|uniref:Cobalamin biosynthesis protein CbiG n=1 Tax=Methylosinus sporium TaxID=428 RepID=A0A2U1STN6_METSR|nr:cobalamin biosynthesis protein [Methylosinus sporium]PWB94962.1 cobalamin biosynthesis protein CbiG [Methylosinus sporium]
MARGEGLSARYAIGLGARCGVEAREAVALIEKAREIYVSGPSPARGRRWPGVSGSDEGGADPHPNAEIALFTIESKHGESGLEEAARLLNLPLVFLPLDTLLARKDELLTRSLRVEALTGVGSVAEAAALVGAGAGSRLFGPRLASAGVTCAIARNALEEAP